MRFLCLITAVFCAVAAGVVTEEKPLLAAANMVLAFINMWLFVENK